jgi:hypothetical protein
VRSDQQHSNLTRRRGSASVAIIVVLMVVSLIIVGMVLAGARDQDLTVVRLDSVRAQYAADAGASMAVREITRNSDDDGDGVVGSISNDGNSSNDPLIGTARVSVTRAGSTLDVIGRSSNARRREQLTVTSAGALTTMTIYSKSGSTTPRTRTWNGTTWSSETSTNDIGSQPRWVVGDSCPVRSEIGAVFCDRAKDLNVMMYTGSAWSTPLEISSNIGTSGDRPAFFAYEQNSGDGLVVYRSGGSTSISYRTWNGASWSAAQTTTSMSAGQPRFMRLIPRPGSDQIMLLSLDDNRDLTGMVWSGSSWGNKVLLDNDTPTSSEECLDAAFESISGDAIVVWGRNGSANVRYRTWSSGGWSGESVGPNMDADARWVRLSNDPASDRVMLMTLNSLTEVHAALWGGTSWAAPSELENDGESTTRRGMDVAFEPGGTRALAVYAQDDQEAVRYRTFNGSSWSAELVGPDLGHDLAAFLLRPNGAGQDIFLLVLTRRDDELHIMRWNGTSLSGAQMLETNLAGGDTHEGYDLVNGIGSVAGVALIQSSNPYP